MEPEYLASALAKGLATATVVVLVTLSVGRFGPVIGGAIAGLPMVLGPGFLFLLLEHSPDYVSAMAASSLATLSGTQAFILVFVVLARRGALLSLAAASGAWFATAFLLLLTEPTPVVALSAFVATTLAARCVADRFRPSESCFDPDLGLAPLLARGAAAGCVVIAAAALGQRFGPVASGLLLAFPVGFAAIAITLCSRNGASAIAAVGHAALLGMGGLAIFAFTMTQTLGVVSSSASFALALGASLSFSAILALVTAGNGND